VVHFGTNEAIIRQGENGDSMFIVVEGELKVLAARDGQTKHISTMSAGDCFGEMSLLTGEKRSATVVASTDCQLVEIDKAAIAQSLKESPNLLAQLSELLARRQLHSEDAFAGRETAAPGQAARQSRYAANFVNRLRSFFEL
jgi:CRP-like cAMP-binding protein